MRRAWGSSWRPTPPRSIRTRCAGSARACTPTDPLSTSRRLGGAAGTPVLRQAEDGVFRLIFTIAADIIVIPRGARNERSRGASVTAIAAEIPPLRSQARCGQDDGVVSGL